MQKGGWETLARAETPRTAFVSQDACVSYGAQGGTIVPYVAPTPTVILSWSPLDVGCQAFVTVTGFADGTYAVTGLPYSQITSIDVSGGTGTATSSRLVFVRGLTWTATVNGVSSGPSLVAC